MNEVVTVDKTKIMNTRREIQKLGENSSKHYTFWDKVLHRGTLISLSILFVIVFYMAFLLLNPYEVIRLEDPEPLKLLKEEYYPGEVVQFQVSFCKLLDLKASVSKYIINTNTNEVYVYLDTPSHVPPGCHDIMGEFTLPKAMTDGTYTYRVVSDYDVNPFRTITYTLSTGEFTVMEAEK